MIDFGTAALPLDEAQVSSFASETRARVQENTSTVHQWLFLTDDLKPSIKTRTAIVKQIESVARVPRSRTEVDRNTNVRKQRALADPSDQVADAPGVHAAQPVPRARSASNRHIIGRQRQDLIDGIV